MVVPLLPLLLLFSSCTTLIADAGAGVDELNYIVLTSSSLKAKAVCEGPRVNTTADFTNWVPVTRPHGPCSAAAAGKSEPSTVDVLRWDQRRAGYIQGMLSVPVNASMGPKLPPPAPTDQSSMDMKGTDPAITATPGTASTKSSQMSIDPAATGGGGGGGGQTMVLDTASIFPWLQCAPCPVPPCHPQKETLYDPAKSPTSATFSCNSPACTQLGPFANGCVNNQCQYRVRYPDGSTTMGTYVSDVMTLTPTRVLPRFQFGCSHFAQGASINTQTAGSMGLGGGPQSLVSQGKDTYGDAFSYCIPPTASTTGFFLLGVPPRSSSRYVVTPMVKDKFNPALYAVRLQAITVAGQLLAVPPTVFAAGSVMDSRAPITRLPPTAYLALRSAFRSRMTMYRMVPPKEHLDTCYDFTGVSTITLPRIVLVFDRNAAVELDPSGVLFDGCLAFTSTADDHATGIIGNVQQRTIEVFYDVGGGAMAFRRGAC
uniref:Uncharacterized protein n=1 Tax=Avena sativa TaxID=4498 RepID=A0ACD5Y8S2_AVESA